MPIYNKPTKLLMRDFAKQKLAPGQIFDKKYAVDWFGQQYPDIRPTTIQMHVEGMAVNSLTRKHHPNIKVGSNHDLFYKVGPGRFRLWDPKSDPAPIYRDQLLDATGEASVEVIEEEEGEASGISREFAFERDLRNYLAKNLHSLEHGLKLYQDEEISGIEFPVGGRFIDILAIDHQGIFVVVELKVSRGYDRVMGQLMRYMGWVKQNLADGQRVRGVIVASDVTEDLRLAASLMPEVGLIEYEISFKLKPINAR